ncbi:MAG: DUF2283 domain-containing protein, partial [Mesorhizobium sp.]
MSCRCALRFLRLRKSVYCLLTSIAGEKAEMTLKLEYDPEANAAYIRFSSE